MIVRITKYFVAALIVGLVLYFYTSSKEIGIEAIVEDQSAGLGSAPIVVAALADGSLSVNGKPVLLEDLEEALAPLMNETVSVEVSVLEETDSMLLIQVMDTARRAGVGPANISVVPRAAD
ncbi:MAG: biopolymer transporter ExbD [Gammaproteobacteria bacterium]|nr:biopolymer transporter ExbD [Gammaproteobacteria bacterium]